MAVRGNRQQIRSFRVTQEEFIISLGHEQNSNYSYYAKPDEVGIQLQESGRPEEKTELNSSL